MALRLAGKSLQPDGTEVFTLNNVSMAGSQVQPKKVNQMAILV
jgi:hypothetical protein